jgi:hypothetical protein
MKTARPNQKSILAMGSTHTASSKYWGLVPGCKGPEPEATYLPPSSAEVKNVLNFTSSLPNISVALYLHMGTALLYLLEMGYMCINPLKTEFLLNKI